MSHLEPPVPVGTNRAGARKDTSWMSLMSLRSGGEHRGQDPNLPPPPLPRVKPRKGEPERKDREQSRQRSSYLSRRAGLLSQLTVEKTGSLSSQA